ncbi:hypothetical protein [Cetobacterium sp.]|uniref:hypothetical protein n=1 Tax=Cetobacterium sp. TaxID=2071632 RepID=UPI002FC7116D
MTKGGKRNNSGRKKIDGDTVRVKIDYETIDLLNQKIEGSTLTEKIRKCLKEYLEGDKNEGN